MFAREIKFTTLEDKQIFSSSSSAKRITLHASSESQKVVINKLAHWRRCNSPHDLLLLTPSDIILIRSLTLQVVAGILASSDDGTFRTDESWKCTTRYDENWMSPSFDDESWPAAVVSGENSDKDIHRNMKAIHEKANWIWTAKFKGTTADSTVYCRGYIGEFLEKLGSFLHSVLRTETISQWRWASILFKLYFLIMNALQLKTCICNNSQVQRVNEPNHGHRSWGWFAAAVKPRTGKGLQIICTCYIKNLIDSIAEYVSGNQRGRGKRITRTRKVITRIRKVSWSRGRGISRGKTSTGRVGSTSKGSVHSNRTPTHSIWWRIVFLIAK